MVPRIPRSTRKKSTIISIFAMSGIELMRVMMASFKPLFLAMSLSGLKILSILKLFKKPRLYFEKKIEKRLARTMMKSSMLAGCLK